MDEKARILQLREELHQHNFRYYVENAPVISDQEFDFLMHELQDLEAKHPEMFDANSPTEQKNRLQAEQTLHLQLQITALSCASSAMRR